MLLFFHVEEHKMDIVVLEVVLEVLQHFDHRMLCATRRQGVDDKDYGYGA